MKKTIIAFTFAIILSAVSVGLVNVAYAGIDANQCKKWKLQGWDNAQQKALCAAVGIQ